MTLDHQGNGLGQVGPVRVNAMLVQGITMTMAEMARAHAHVGSMSNNTKSNTKQTADGKTDQNLAGWGDPSLLGLGRLRVLKVLE